MRSAEVPGEGESPVITGLSVYGARGTRTPDLLGAIQALSQLSYSPGRAVAGIQPSTVKRRL